MPKKTPQVIIYLRQLSKPELLKLAEQKKVRIPVKWEKSKIVEMLSTVSSANEVTAFISKKTKMKTKEGQAIEKVLKGKNLEERVSQIFARNGFQCESVRLAGMQIDIYGERKRGFISKKEYVIIECKNKSKVIPEDFKKFIGNFDLLIRKKGLDEDAVKGYLYTTGIFDKDTKALARDYPRIQLKRVKL